MKLQSMKLSKAEQKESMPSVAKMDKPEYPYGLRLDLGKDVLEKLDMKKLPQVGDKIMVMAMAEVCSVSEHDSEYGGKSKSVGLQITEMALGKGESAPAEDKLYNKG